MSEGIRSISQIVAKGLQCNGKYIRGGGTTVFSERDQSASRHKDLAIASGIKIVGQIGSGVDAGQYFFVPPAMLYLTGSGFDNPVIPTPEFAVAAKEATRASILLEEPGLNVSYDA